MKSIEKQVKNQNGITLVALVVTIVLLIILAVVSINAVMGENGIIKSTDGLNKMQRMAEEKERIELIKANVAVDNRGKIPLDKFIEELIKAGITSEDEIETNEDGSKQVITDNGYSVNIKQDGENNVIIDVEGKVDSLPVKIVDVSLTTSANSIKVELEVKRGEGATYKYYYRLKGTDETAGTEYGEAVYEGTNASYTIENLKQNETYVVKVEAINKNGTATAEKECITGDLGTAEGIIEFENFEWIEEKANVTIIKNTEDNLRIQYRVLDAELNVIKDYTEITSESKVEGLNNGETVEVRLWDGINGSDTASLTVVAYNISIETVTGGSVTADMGTAPSGQIVILTPTESAGYTYNGATVSYVDGTINLDASTKTFTMPIGDVIITPKWNANSGIAYTVKHYTENLNSTEYSLNTTENLTGTTASEVTPAVKSITGFTAPSTQTVTIEGDGSTVINYYYTRNSYTFTLGSGTGVSTSGSTATGSYEYETTITLKATASAGYTWSKWTSSNTNLVADNATANTTIKMPAGNITMTPSATLITYTITYNLNSGTQGSNAKTSYNVTTATFNLPTPTRANYNFKGWYTNSSFSGSVVTQIAKGSTGNKTYYAKWETATIYLYNNGDACTSTSGGWSTSSSSKTGGSGFSSVSMQSTNMYYNCSAYVHNTSNRSLDGYLTAGKTIDVTNLNNLIVDVSSWSANALPANDSGNCYNAFSVEVVKSGNIVASKYLFSFTGTSNKSGGTTTLNVPLNGITGSVTIRFHSDYFNFTTTGANPYQCVYINKVYLTP